jgi:hypothetical protein
VRGALCTNCQHQWNHFQPFLNLQPIINTIGIRCYNYYLHNLLFDFRLSSATTASTMGNLIMNRARYINMDDVDREILLHKRREYKKLRQCGQDDTITGEHK